MNKMGGASCRRLGIDLPYNFSLNITFNDKSLFSQFFAVVNDKGNPFSSFYSSAPYQVVNNKLVIGYSNFSGETLIFDEEIDYPSVGFGPEFWNTKLSVDNDSFIFSNEKRGFLSSFYFRHFKGQDFSHGPEENIRYSFYNENMDYLVSGNFPKPYGDRQGVYTFEAEKEYFIGPFSYSGKISLMFDTLQEDSNPPFLRLFKFRCDNKICDNLKPGVSKKGIFEIIDENGISFFEFSYLNGLEWTPLGSNFISGKYEVEIPDISQDKIRFRIFANDTSNNSLTYFFEMPSFEIYKKSVSYCQDLEDENVAYYLNNSLESSAMCFNITANNVLLDCSDFKK